MATVLDHVADVALVYWLMGSATGEPDAVAAVHGGRLERLLENLVDTPVRGVVYEAAGSAPRTDLERGAAAVRDAGRIWRIPFAIVEAPLDPYEGWRTAMLEAAGQVLETSN